MSLLANSNAIESGGYPIQRSLRFRSSASAYLSRTPATTTNRKTWTFSCWFKRGQIGGAYFRLFNASYDNSNRYELYFDTSNNALNSESMIAGTAYTLTTTQVFRDPSAWYHLVVMMDTTQATASNREKIYINGQQITSFLTANYPPQNADVQVNAWDPHNIGRSQIYGSYFDGYMAEINHIDGQALTPSSFGQTDPVTGVWTPKKYAGTYGTNGFYLPFSDNTSATTLAYDKSGNGNNWTPNNISTTAGATYDSMTDVPTLTSTTAANYCVLNPLNKGSDITVSKGNLSVESATDGSYSVCYGTIGVSSGKWYWEQLIGSYNRASVGVAKAGENLNSYLGSGSGGYAYNFSGEKQNNGSNTAYGATYTTGDVIGVALDCDAGTITFYKNNASQGVAFSSLSGEFFPAISDASSGGRLGAEVNFGQRPFAYTPPTGFKALNTFNLD